MKLDLSKFQGSFFDESDEHLHTMEEGLLQLEQRPADLDLLDRIFRAAHSIKGNSGMFGFSALAEFTHQIENILDALRTGRMPVTRMIIDLLLEATDGLKGLLGATRTQSAPDQELLNGLGERLRACGTSAAPATDPQRPARRPEPAAPMRPSDTKTYEIVWRPSATLFQRGLDPLRIIADLRGLGALTTSVHDLETLPRLEDLDPERCYLGWSFRLATAMPRSDIDAVFVFVRDDSVLTITERVPAAADAGGGDGAHQPLGEILVQQGAITPEALQQALSQQKRLGEILIQQQAVTPAQVAQALERQHQQEKAAAGRKTDTTSIRVDTDKIDKLINLVGELVITQSMLSELGARFEITQLPVLLERLAQLERNTREIQDRVMAVRMLPIGTAFQRFPRLVRDLASKNGKDIQLQLSGEETELDKTVIESIGDPLTHLVRNAADHGLEPPEERAACGKPAQGTIRLDAYHEGGTICITVEDDGRGLNQAKILAKARTLGLVSETEALTDDEVCALIFRPGFSTADRVTDVSGRGVGMDVVKRNIDALGGSVAIRTVPGHGTTFTLKLPLTLAIIEGMTVRVGPEIYILPLVSIVESTQPAKNAVQTVAGRGEVVSVRGVYVPVIRLYEVFDIVPEQRDPARGILVILETEGKRVAVLVDELLGQQQVVIKSLEKNFRKVDGIAGATILGDGTIGFILDVRSMVQLMGSGDRTAA